MFLDLLVNLVGDLRRGCIRDQALEADGLRECAGAVASTRLVVTALGAISATSVARRTRSAAVGQCPGEYGRIFGRGRADIRAAMRQVERVARLEDVWVCPLRPRKVSEWP